MIARDVEFPYVHDLDQLLTLLEETRQPVPDEIHQAERLTRYAMAARYPGMERPVSEQEHAEAVAVAEAVVQWAEERL